MTEESDDLKFLLDAFRKGTWERYEHPEKGETLTLSVGNFPILSIHNILVERPHPVASIDGEVTSMAMVAMLISKVANLEYELNLATQAIVEKQAMLEGRSES